jgi:DNA (cytosine-5)-methyltransferase 1
MHKMHRASQDNYYSDAFIQGRFDEGTSSVVLHREGHDCIRKITPLEAFRIQAFPESAASRWLSLGFPDSRYYMAAGNAVPPPLAEVVLELVACHALN